MKKNHIPGVACILLVAIWAANCEHKMPTEPAPFASVSEWVANVNWDKKMQVVVNMVETGGHFAFSPNNLSFEAGQPYVLKIVNPVGNSNKHYFATENASDFFKAIATRKIQTPDAEYKAPYFKAVELLIGGELEIYFVPVIGGKYDFLCTITGHAEAGMTGEITITGGIGYNLDLQMDPDFDMELTVDPRVSGSHEVWSNAEKPTVVCVEHPDGSLAYNPSELHLIRDKGYKISIENPSRNVSKHYFTASAFYRTAVTRKAEDSNAEIKFPYINAVELLIGGKTELFVVPTQAGTFEVLCTIPGHKDAGMHGHIIVNEHNERNPGNY